MGGLGGLPVVPESFKTFVDSVDRTLGIVTSRFFGVNKNLFGVFAVSGTTSWVG